MQGIDTNEHKNMLEAFRRFEELSSVIKDKITIEEEIKTREGMKELIGTYQHFKYLLSELESCKKGYEKKRKSVQGVLYKSIRRMNSEIKKNPAKEVLQKNMTLSQKVCKLKSLGFGFYNRSLFSN
ncbi:hypothetical protein, partial [Flavobacterium fluviatile]|uniref:hypothetical protein n=1 Tax=Flavobacterium fluviatile TaxID=1862387 RepID=UPI0013CFEF9F